MVNCWEEYLWKVHKAVAVDPWASNVQLLDVLIQERSPSLWQLFKTKGPMSRAGSLHSLGIKLDSSSSSKPKVDVANANGGGAAADRNGPDIQLLFDSLLMKPSGMPDIQASIKSSNSLVSSITSGSSASAQFDVKGSKTVSCNVGGVESQRVDMDALMELVTPRAASSALWRPDISLPQLQWPCERGQTLWVVTEIMYASLIKIEGDQQRQANATAKVSKGGEVEMKEQVGVEREGVWTVTGKPTFPFALRLQRLNYDACGSLIISKSKASDLNRTNSLSNRITRQLSSKHVNALYHSSSVSRRLP